MRIEDLWLKLVHYFGIAPPQGCSERELNEWARPDTPHPARRNRPQLYAILQHALNGTIESLTENGITVPGGHVRLGNIPEFNELMSVAAPMKTTRGRIEVLDWVNTFSPRNANLLGEMSDDELESYSSAVLDFLDRDQQLFMRSSAKLRRFEETQNQIESVRMAVLEIETDDRQERIEHLDDYTEYVLGPLAQSIQTYEQIRSSYLDHIKKQTLDMVMASAGITVTPIDFPSVDEIETVLNGLPRLDEALAFQEFKNNRSFQLVSDKLEAWVEDVQEQFETKVDLDHAQLLSDLKKGKVNIQINQCFAGTMKNVLYNPENEFSS